MSLCIWNSDTTFGRKDTLVNNLTAWDKNAIKGGLMSRAANLLAQHTNVIATKDKVFSDSSQVSQVAASSNKWHVRQLRTKGKSQSSVCHFTGGDRCSRSFRNYFAKGKTVYSVMVHKDGRKLYPYGSMWESLILEWEKEIEDSWEICGNWSLDEMSHWLNRRHLCS